MKITLNKEMLEQFKNRRKPYLTKKVVRGLLHLSSYAMAGGPEDIGIDSKKEWDDVCRAIEWIQNIRDFKDVY